MSNFSPVIFHPTHTIPTDFLAAAGMGAYSNISVVHKFGHNPDVGTTFETIWEEGGVYAFLAAATILKISSSDIDDDDADTGAQTIIIEGLDANYAEISETVIMNGQTAVNTVNEYLRVNRMYVVTTGATGWNEGIIYAGTGTVTTGKPANVYGLIGATNNQSLLAFYSVPADKTAYLFDYQASSSISKDIDLRVMIRENGSGIFRTHDYISFTEGLVSHPGTPPEEIAEQSDIQIQARAAAGSGSISAGFHIVLMDN